MSLENTDNTKKFMDLFDLLPDVYKSNTNRSVFNMLFNRFLSKQDVKKVAGYIGDPNKNAVVRRQIEEPTIHRQAFQLQPILNTLIGAVRYQSSWKDIEKEIARLGVDIDRLDQWANPEVFNWIPPIDIDKLINYGDYYWVSDDHLSQPEYITIRSKCQVAKYNVNLFDKITEQHGEEIQIRDIKPYTDPALFKKYDIISIDISKNEIKINGDITEYLGIDDFLHIQNTTKNNGKYQIKNIKYDKSLNGSVINVEPGKLKGNSTNKGEVIAKFFDKIIISGDKRNLFKNGFIFFVKKSKNIELDRSFIKTIESTYDKIYDETLIKIDEIITDDEVSGMISFTELKDAAKSQQHCLCNEEAPWDLYQWDDNPHDPLGGGVQPGNRANWLDKIKNPSHPPSTGDLRYDKSRSNNLERFDEKDNQWHALIKNFTHMLNQTKGISYWDYIADCNKVHTIESADQWIDNNYWIHKSQLKDSDIARRAQVPIIEYHWDIQLNEWSYTEYVWKYRTWSTTEWEETDKKPTLFDLKPITLWETLHNSHTIIIDERYGDMTDVFVPGFQFGANEAYTSGIIEKYTVERSYYSRENANGHFTTKIVIHDLVANTLLQPGDLTNGIESKTPLHPLHTSLGDEWDKYGAHWLFVKAKNSVPSDRVPYNEFLDIPEKTKMIDHSSNKFSYVLTPYVQQMIMDVNDYNEDIMFIDQTNVDSSRPLRRMALVGSNDVKVYINNVRQYGNFDEISEKENNIEYVKGIRFLKDNVLKIGDVLKIEVGEATHHELGWSNVPVRMHELNEEFKMFGYKNISLVSYRKTDQVKSKNNQYPLFDLFNPDGSNAFKANGIFGFRTGSDYPINKNVGLRLVHDPLTKVFDFEQHLIDEDNGPLYAYRDFSHINHNYWFNPLTNELKFWKHGCWNEKILMGNHYRKGIVSINEPGFDERKIDGLYWFDTGSNKLKKRNIQTSSWDYINDVTISNNDTTLQTIWRCGLNHERYIPKKVDWDKRTQAEYDEEKLNFIDQIKNDIKNNNVNKKDNEAETEATNIWNIREANVHSPDGKWKGDWEIPDPLFYNHMHENRKILNSAELREHFNSIINNQTKLPGYTGTAKDMFCLIPANEVNYGLGGKIHEYNDGFDTFLSSAFVNNVTPVSLIEFAKNQYSGLLVNSIIDMYTENIIDYLTNSSTDDKQNIKKSIIDTIILNHWKNDYLNFIYGDLSTFDDNTNSGMKNWIATLPYIGVIKPQQPIKLIDHSIGISQLKHHDGHYQTYKINPAEQENIINKLIIKKDDRIKHHDTWGRKNVLLPPNNIKEFESFFRTDIKDREGVFWYWIPSFSVRILYRLNLVSTSPIKPVGEFEDGSLWFDTNDDLLKMKKTNSQGYPVWDEVDGISQGRLHNGTNPTDLRTASVSAWEEININDLLIDVLFEVEQKLYDNAPTTPLRYNMNKVRNINPHLFDQYLEDAFRNYVTEKEIINPFSNIDYDQKDPWTWNYKYSIPGGGISIVNADSKDNTIHILGDYESTFDPCSHGGMCPSQIEFYIKNSRVNDGTWKTLESVATQSPVATYDIANNTTTIKVDGIVSPSIEGFVYQGELPGSHNTGAETGAYWKTLYNDFYGTPYPNIEPWILQGYDTKPIWWDTEYLNDDEQKWGNRRWKYAHGFDILNTGFERRKGFLGIKGNFLSSFKIGEKLEIDRIEYSGIEDAYLVGFKDEIQKVDLNNSIIEIKEDKINQFKKDNEISIFKKIANQYILVGVYKILNSTYTGPPSEHTVIELEGEISRVIEPKNCYIGALYNKDENKTKIFVTTKLKNASAGKLPLARINKSVGMWNNIIKGAIPPGKLYPNGVLSKTGIPYQDKKDGIEAYDVPKWKYLSVNIDNLALSDNGDVSEYNADDLLPPYWNYKDALPSPISTFDNGIRSIFYDFDDEIISPAADYTFNDGGPVEWDWRSSVNYNYDHLIACYRLDPVRYVTGTFGVDFNIVGNLQVEKNTRNTFAHQRTMFHGDILEDKVLKFNGTNQWYVNFNRYLSFDNNYSDFASLWKTWNAPLTYQYATFIDTPSFQLGHRRIDMIDSDYYINTKISRGVEDFWMDAFKLIVTNIPPNILRYDTQHEWEIELNSHVAISRDIKYFDVQNYQFFADWRTDLCTLYTWKIQNVDVYNGIFEIPKDQSNFFKQNNKFTVSQSLGNDGIYTIRHSVYNAQTDTTMVEVEEMISDIRSDGMLTLNDFRKIPWETGEMIYISSSETLPSPFHGITPSGLEQLFIIKLNDNQFQLARTSQDAESGNHIDITSSGRGDQYVGKVHSTFKAMDGNRTDTIWIHYEQDTTRALMASLPTKIKGIQNLINFIDGYDSYSRSGGWRINDEYELTDKITGRPVNWQLEVERFIDYVYGLRIQRYKVKDHFEVTADAPNNEFTLIDNNPKFRTGDKIILESSNGIYPDPIFKNLIYYYIHVDGSHFQIASTRRNAERGMAIDLLTTKGVDNLYLTKPNDRREDFPKSGINPFRSSIWFKPPHGVISNIITNPTEDIRTIQTVVDQYGRKINANDVSIFREDKRTQISVRDNLPNTREPPVFYFYPSYDDYIHIAGIHLFIDSYEHTLVFNNYTKVHDLIYDPFLGISATKFEMLFNRQKEFTQRPNVSGYYYHNDHNLGGDLIGNIEYGVESLRYAYDTFNILESNKLASEVRKGLGYTGIKDYLSEINVNEKSQFLFWRGFINHKGTKNSIHAFLQSRRFKKAKEDEFWAVKVGEFGSNKDKEFPEMYITTNDTTSNETRFEFIEPEINL